MQQIGAIITYCILRSFFKQMVYSTCFVSLMMTISLFLYSSTIATSLRDHSTPIKSHNADLVIDDGIVARNHFADFLRALYAPQATTDHLAMVAENDMPNDIFPLTPVGEEHDIHDEDYDRDQTRQNEFPVDGVLLPILQKRNARYCGSFLADALQLACSSRSFLAGKRSTSAQGIFER